LLAQANNQAALVNQQCDTEDLILNQGQARWRTKAQQHPERV
jgi:hypothetical protein